MVSGGSDGIVILEDRNQLAFLAVTLRNREERMISSCKSFKTEEDRVNYLRSVNEAYTLTMDLLKDANSLKHRTLLASDSMLQDRDAKRRKVSSSSIVNDIDWYIHIAVCMALQGFRNCALRANYLSKLRKHFNALAEEVERQDFAVGEEGVLKLIEEAKACKEAMWSYASRFRSAGGRFFAEIYRSKVREKGETIADVVKSHQNKLGLEGEFQSLEEKEQLQVYNSVIEEALGESYGFVDKLALVGGPAVFLTTAGLMVYDVIAADNHTEAALHDALDLLNMAAGFAVQVTLEIGLTELLTAMGVGALVVSPLAFFIGCGAGYLFSWKLGEAIDRFIRGGGTEAPALEGLTFHKVTAPPDGMKIANEIARDFAINN